MMPIVSFTMRSSKSVKVLKKKDTVCFQAIKQEKVCFQAMRLSRLSLMELLKDDNGVTSRGQSVLSNDNFELFIKETGFYIRAGTIHPETQQRCASMKFADAWSAQGKNKNRVLVNRVAAACTLEVSTTVVRREVQSGIQLADTGGNYPCIYSRRAGLVFKKHFPAEFYQRGV